jgi:hypothetical protein
LTGTVDEFYEVPDPLTDGAPGELIADRLAGVDPADSCASGG